MLSVEVQLLKAQLASYSLYRLKMTMVTRAWVYLVMTELFLSRRVRVLALVFVVAEAEGI